MILLRYFQRILFPGLIAFITVAIIFYVKPLCDQCHTDIELREKLIFLFFFLGAILCLGMSSLFHTVCCHSEHVSRLFNKVTANIFYRSTKYF